MFKTAEFDDLPMITTPTTPPSWATIAQKSAVEGKARERATSCPTQKPMSSPYLGFETMMPKSKSPSPNSKPLSCPPEYVSAQEVARERVQTEEPIQTFSEKLTLQVHSEPGRLIDPFCVEVHLHPNDCGPNTKHDLGEITKQVLGEIHVVPNRDYFFNGNVVLCYTVFPYRKTLAQVKRQNLSHELAWKARIMWKPELASALTQALIDLFPRASPSPVVPSVGHPMTREAFRKHQSLPEIDSYMEPSPSQSPYLEPQTSSHTRAFQNLVQPAVTHLVSKTKKKRAKGLPTDYRARQNLVQQKHDKALAMLKPWLLDETEEKIYLRGDNVSFIQVKCPRALHAVDEFLEQILNDESIEIVRCTAPLSRKRQGQLKGYLLYLQCKTAANVARINEIFEKDFAKSGLKCKIARFEKVESESSVEESSL